MQLQDFIKETFDNYNTFREDIHRDAIEIGQQYYSNQPFLKKLKEI